MRILGQMQSERQLKRFKKKAQRETMKKKTREGKQTER